MFRSGVGSYRRKSPQAKVMLTSMMDMFTIILVFLLYSYSTEEQNFHIEKNLTLPVSNAQERLETAISVVISRDAITVEDVVVAHIHRGQLRQTIVRENRIVPLMDELKRYKDMAITRAYQRGEALTESDDIVLVQADQGTPFHILDMVLKSSGVAGFPKFRFAVFRREA